MKRKIKCITFHFASFASFCGFRRVALEEEEDDELLAANAKEEDKVSE